MSTDAKIIAGVALSTVIIVVVAAFTVGKNSSKPIPAVEHRTLNAEESKVLLRSDSHVIKASNSKVTVVEFGDFQCPACGIAYTILKKVEKDYNGRVNFAFRNFPISAHKNGYISSLAAEAAGGQGKYWQMFDKLYENQDKWSEEKDPIKFFEKYAGEIGINIEKFNSDIKSKKYDAKIKEDMNDGLKIGINSTPSFFINNKLYIGVIQYDDFRNEIESLLKKK